VKPIHVDIRVISATHQDLKKAVLKKKFREDLYYRLNVIPIEIPPLRERKSDIPLLAHHFIQHFSKSKKKKVIGISDEAMEGLTEYDWPGNVRELENMIERLIILASGETIHLMDLPERVIPTSSKELGGSIDIPEEGVSLETALNEFEKRLILNALNKSGWVKNKAAQMLHMNRTTLIEKIKRQNLQRPTS